MNKLKIYSYAKVNLSLRVIKKLNDGFHKIQSLVAFVSIYDKIYIKNISSKKDKIKFYGKFSKNIFEKNNSILNTLNILRKNNYLKKKYFDIKIEKNIPVKAGLGGGSMNAASLMIFLNKKFKLKIKKNKMISMASEIGSDVILGLDHKSTLFYSGNNKIKKYKRKLKLFVLLVKPNISCSTKLIYSKIKQFSKSYRINKKTNFQSLFNLNNIKLDVNDLEKIVFKIYPKIRILRQYLGLQKKCEFSRMSGSGSVCIGYFKDLKYAKKARLNINNKFPNYWCKVSKAM